MSEIHAHEMTGLKPDALATYLAAMGLFRLLSEQKDASARGFWRDEHFVLVSELDLSSLEQFFLLEYEPTPILAPWSGGGGFLDIGEDDSETASTGTKNRIDQLIASTSRRFRSFRQAIASAKAVIPPELPQARRERDRLTSELRAQRAVLRNLHPGSDEYRSATQRLKEVEKLRDRAREFVEKTKNEVKAGLLRKIASGWEGAARDWFDASVILDTLGEPAYPPQVGTGGNEGNLDYTAGFQDNLFLLFRPNGEPMPAAQLQLMSLLRSNSAPVLKSQSVGQFAPGRAGGANMGSGFGSEPAINPWEFVLMLEGAVALVAGMTRRGGVGRARMSSPFWVEAAPAGFASASELEDSPRGEQWLPLWSHPLRYSELVELIREGRAQIGQSSATKAGDLVRATARLGLARGIESLQRFAYLERNGQSNLAISAGRFWVASRSNQALLDDIAPWIDRLAANARRTKDNNVPLSLGAVARKTQEALFAVCRHNATPTEWRNLLIALGEAELALLRSGKNPARRPLPRLSPGWISAVDDCSEQGRTTLRLALALASQHQPPEKNDLTLKGSVRCHFIPLEDPDQEWPWFRVDKRDPEWVCMARDLVADAIALVQRRSIWARRSEYQHQRTPRLPLCPTACCEATPDEIGLWLRNDQFDNEILRLARPLLALNWRKVAQQRVVPLPFCRGTPDPLQLLFRIAHLPFDIPVQESIGKSEVTVTVPLDPEPLRRLATGDLDGALNVATRRLSASGLRPVFRHCVGTPALTRRLAASLAFPISRSEAAYVARLVCKPYEARDMDKQAFVYA